MQQLHNEIDQTTADLTRLSEQIKQILAKVDVFVAMQDGFKGKAANSIRAFYQESHMPLLLFMEGFITDFQDALAKIKNSLAYLEPDEQGYIHEAFLQEDVRKGIKNAENVTMSLTDETNRVISSVGDILSLPSVDDSDFLDQAQRARKKVDLTLEKLYTFDSESIRALDRPQNDLDVMQTYINELGGMVSSGKINIGNYSVQQLSEYDFHQALISGVRGKAGKNMLSLDVLIGLGAAKLLSRVVPYAGNWVNMLAKKYERKTAEYSFRALNVVSASVGSHISEQEFATVKGQVMDTVKVSDYQGEWYGNYMTLMDGRILREYMDPDGNVNYQFVSSIPESRLKPEGEEKEESGFMAGLKGFGKGTVNVVKSTADFLILDDFRTLGSSESSKVDKVISGASLIPVGKVLKLRKAGNLFKRNKNGDIPAKRTGKVNSKVDLDNLLKQKTIGRGSTGRTKPNNLKEQLALKEVLSNPNKGNPVPLRKGMTDPRWPSNEGWIKMSKNVNGVEIHYLKNTKTGHFDDFKFK